MLEREMYFKWEWQRVGSPMFPHLSFILRRQWPVHPFILDTRTLANDGCSTIVETRI